MPLNDILLRSNNGEFQLPNRCENEITLPLSSQLTSTLNNSAEDPRNNSTMNEFIPPSSIDYRFEINRLKTFTEHNWPHNFLEPSKMASAGFYFLGENDICRCHFCQVKIGNWEVGDDPMREHQRWADHCPLVRHRPTGNVPINETNPPLGITSNGTETSGQDECGRFNQLENIAPVEIRPNTIPESGNLESLSIYQSRPPSFPHMGPFNSRLDSFKNWPKSMKQRPEQLCEAGFFYTGNGDQTICYHCGGGLKDWDETDDPWTEHAKWFSKCAFLLLVKGKAFVDQVINVKSGNNGEDSSTQPKPSTSAEEKIESTSTSETNNSSLDDPRLCKICYNEEVGVVFLPCGHFVACVKCAPTLSNCAICRKPFSATVRAFLS